MIKDYILNFLFQLTALDWAYIGGIVLAISGFLEKTFDIKFIGRWTFRAIGILAKWLFNKFILLPFDKEIKAINAALKPTKQLEAKFLEVFNRDTTQAAQILEILERLTNLATSIDLIEKEVKYNGGGSLKDAVMKHREETLANHGLLEKMQIDFDLVNVRLEILDALNPQMIFRLSADLECVFISDSFLKYFGWSADDINGFNWEVAIADESRDLAIEKWQRARKLKARYYNKQYLIGKDGEKHLCLVHGFPRVINKELIGFFGYVEILDDESSEIHKTDDYLTGKSFWKERELKPPQKSS